MAHPRGRAIANLLGTALIAIGVLIPVGAGVMHEYGRIAQANLAHQATRSLDTTKVNAVATTDVPPTNVPTAAPLFTPTTATAAHPTSTLAARPITIEVAPTPTPRPIYPAVRIVAAAIGLDASVVESPLVNGQWTIPKFAAGHLQGTAQPLSGGNVVLIGHVQSITSGDVFAQINNLQAGDVIRLYTKAGTLTYDVRKVRSVRNDDMSVLGPQRQETLTLITCAGSWLPLQEDYSRRTVVVAVLDHAT